MYENITVKNLRYFINKLSNSSMLFDALKYDYLINGAYFDEHINVLEELNILSISNNSVSLKQNIDNNNFSAELIKKLSKDESDYGNYFRDYITKFKLISGKYVYSEKTLKYSSIRNLLYSLGVIQKDESDNYNIDELYHPYISSIINLSIETDSNVTTEKKIQAHLNDEKTIIKTDKKFINNLKEERGYTCEACGFIFKNVYKDNNYIEAHHLKSKKIANKKLKIGEIRLIKKDDFAILCANCHRMIHQYMASQNVEDISLQEFKKNISKKYISLIEDINE
jgi:hypothetical protein